MAADNSSTAPVAERLHLLGLSLVVEWDTLVFLYAHSNSLGTAAEIARLLGSGKAEVGSALYKLESLGLIHRSRVSDGTRIFRYIEPPDPSSRSCLLDLLDLAQTRTGRLSILKHLKRPRAESRRSRNSGLRLA